MDDVFIGYFKFLLLEVGISWGCSHLRHVEYLKHGIEVKMFHVQALENDLRYDEIYVLLLKLNFFKEIQEEFLSYCALSVTFSSQSSHNLLVVGGNKLCNLYEHFLFLFLRHYFIFWHQFSICCKYLSLCYLLCLV